MKLIRVSECMVHDQLSPAFRVLEGSVDASKYKDTGDTTGDREGMT